MPDPTSADPPPTPAVDDVPYAGEPKRRRTRAPGVISLVFGILLAAGVASWLIAGALQWAS